MFAQVSAVPLLQLWGVRKGEGLLKRTVVKNKGFGIGEGTPLAIFQLWNQEQFS